MPEPEVFAAYAASIAERLDFDPSLSRRVRQEVEDHLWESASTTKPNSAQEATARFGDPQVLAAEFATVWLGQKTRNLNTAAFLLVLALLVIMKARLAWYGFAQWPLPEEVRSVGAAVALVDVYAFWLAASLVVVGWGLIFSYRATMSPAALCRRFRNVVNVISLSILALIVSVTCDVVLTALRLIGRDFSAQVLIPMASIAAETGLIGVLILKIATLTIRMPRVTTLLESDTPR
jgi:hypothetical protein